jgi:hypothetical protein
VVVFVLWITNPMLAGLEIIVVDDFETTFNLQKINKIGFVYSVFGG